MIQECRPGTLTIRPKENPGFYDIEMDGVPIDRVDAVHIHMEPNALPVVFLSLAPTAVNVEFSNPHVELITGGKNDE